MIFMVHECVLPSFRGKDLGKVYILGERILKAIPELSYHKGVDQRRHLMRRDTRAEHQRMT